MSRLENYIGETLDGKYRLERLLGKGGMGAVYLATHLGTERFVALKLISPQFMSKDEFVERFKREARAAGRLRHPNVVDVTDFGFAQVEDGGRVAYLVMEYLDGCTLADVLEEEKRLSLDWVVDIIEQVCSAVDEAHAQGIVHRDLKPDNIWLEPNRLGGYRVKVLDFGIAKLGEPSSLHPNENSAPAISSHLSHEMTPAALPTRSVEAREDDQMLGIASETFSNAAGEAATRLFNPSTIDEESGTLLLAPQTQKAGQATASPTTSAVSAPEAATQIPPTDDRAERESDGEEDGTRLFDAPPTAPEKISTAQAAAATDSLNGNLTREVTRVGAIIGTPLYMSPEQCRGESLDARSDIYSLGVIAYQMLAGETPFAGDLTSVIKQHKFSAPPKLDEKNGKVPKRVARVVETALDKDRNQRPPTATAFASELSASAEGMGALVRRAFALYSEHFTTFLRISLLAHLPSILIVILQLVNDWAEPLLSKWLFVTFAILLSLSLFVTTFIGASVITGMTVLIVAQLIIAPLRPVRLRALFELFKKRLRAFLTTSLLVSAVNLLGVILFIIPGLIAIVRYSLYAPIVMLEGLRNRAAMRRSAELVRRSRLSVIAIVLIEFSIPFLVQMIFINLFGGMKTERTANGIHVHPGLPIVSHLGELLNIFVVPILSILTALLYFKLRQLGGEPMKAIAESLNEGDTPRSGWQIRAHSRLTQTFNSLR